MLAIPIEGIKVESDAGTFVLDIEGAELSVESLEQMRGGELVLVVASPRSEGDLVKVHAGHSGPFRLVVHTTTGAEYRLWGLIRNLEGYECTIDLTTEP